jgi:hypothetical protein
MTINTAPPTAGSSTSKKATVGKWFGGVGLGIVVTFVASFFSGAGLPIISHFLPDTVPPASLSVTTLSSAGVNPVAVQTATTAGVTVKGDVHGVLRSGQTVFVLWRAYDGSASEDATLGTVYSGLPCVVKGDTFKCDAPWLGSRPGSGVSMLWVGIANSSATRALSLAYAQQRETGHAGDGPQPEPNGFVVEGAFHLRWPPQ